MAIISLTIPATAVDRIQTAYAAAYGYQATIDTGVDDVATPNPETLSAFTKRMVVRQIKEIVKGYENQIAIQAAKDTTAQSIDAINIT